MVLYHIQFKMSPQNEVGNILRDPQEDDLECLPEDLEGLHVACHLEGKMVFTAGWKYIQY